MSAVAKIDLYKLHKDEYASPRKPALVTLGQARYLSVEGQGEPGGEDFQAKVGALYAMAYTIKMTRKGSGDPDYTVCKLEAQWWSSRKGKECHEIPGAEWRWRLMIRTPDFVETAELDTAAAALESKGKGEHAREVTFESLEEGRCVQMLHVGPYDQEGETLRAMREFTDGESLEWHGHHHEVYLSHPRRVPPERLKTILRRPVR